MLVLFAYLQSWIGDRLDSRDRGATAVEYGLMIALIAVAVIGVIALLGDQLAAMFDGVSDELPQAPAP